MKQVTTALLEPTLLIFTMYLVLMASQQSVNLVRRQSYNNIDRMLGKTFYKSEAGAAGLFLKFCNIHRKTPVWGSLFNKVASPQASPFKKAYFEEHLRTAASEKSTNKHARATRATSGVEDRHLLCIKFCFFSWICQVFPKNFPSPPEQPLSLLWARFIAQSFL